jgi:hypothetical protein
MIIPPNQGQPIVDKFGMMSQVFRAWTQGVSKLEILDGAGSPEGVVSARQRTLYMDTAGTAGAILYIKRDTDVGGDTKQGWILV